MLKHNREDGQTELQTHENESLLSLETLLQSRFPRRKNDTKDFIKTGFMKEFVMTLQLFYDNGEVNIFDMNNVN